MAQEDQRSLGEITQDLSEQTATLVRKELALATAELKEKGKHAGIGIGLFGGAGLFALLGLGALVATAILALAELLAPPLAALVVTAVLFAIAGAAALIGKGEVEEASPPLPEQAKHGVAVDVETVKEASRRGTER